MNKKFYLLAIVPAVLAINGCNKTVNDGPAPKYITVSTDIATKVSVELQLTDPSIRAKDRIVKKSVKDGFYTALYVGCVWLKRALAAK